MTENKYTISVIIPAYNCEQYLAETIESVLAQTYRPIEITVVDNGSTDSSGDVVKLDVDGYLTNSRKVVPILERILR